MPAAPKSTTSIWVVPSVMTASSRAGGRPERVRREDACSTWAWTVAASPSTRVLRSVSSPQDS